MLIKVKQDHTKSEDIKPSPYADEGGKRTASRNAIPLRMNRVPEPGSGTRVVPMEELAGMMASSPAMRKAVGLVERVYECETGIKRAMRKQLTHDRESALQAAATKRAIDLGLSKQKFRDSI